MLSPFTQQDPKGWEILPFQRGEREEDSWEHNLHKTRIKVLGDQKASLHNRDAAWL